MSFLSNIFHQFSRLGEFWQEKSNSNIFRWNLIFIIVQIAFLVWKFGDLPLQVPLYYSLPWGESQLASASSLFLLPTFSIILLLINHLFALPFSKTIPLLSSLLISVSLIASLFFLITLVEIVSLIT